MHPDEEEIEKATSVTPEELIRWTKRLRVSIDVLINECGWLADLCSDGDGSGLHGLQMSYDKLKEAKMWAGDALGELGHPLPQEYRDEAKKGR